MEALPCSHVIPLHPQEQNADIAKLCQNPKWKFSVSKDSETELITLPFVHQICINV